MSLKKTDSLGRPLPSKEDEAGWRALLHRHETELWRRRSWCIENNHVPAFDNEWRAPGDDANFMFGVAPWHADGTVNPDGVPYSLEWFEAQVAPEAVGWECKRCNKWVETAPRKFTNGKEPVDWWWCLDCKKTAKRPTKKEVKQETERKSMKPIESFLQRKRAKLDAEDE